MKFIASIFIAIASLFGVNLQQTPQPTPTPVVSVSVTPEIIPNITSTLTPKKAVKTPTPAPVSTPTSTPAVTPLVKTPTPTPNQTEAYRQYLIAQINSIIQQKYQQLLVQQQQQQQYQQQLQSIVNQINQIKADYYTKVAEIQNQTIPMTLINGQISQLTNQTNLQINQLTSQYNLLLSQQGAPLNYQISQSLTLPQTNTVWRIDGSLNGMSGTISGSNGQLYRWDCTNYTSCTLY